MVEQPFTVLRIRRRIRRVEGNRPFEVGFSFSIPPDLYAGDAELRFQFGIVGQQFRCAGQIIETDFITGAEDVASTGEEAVGAGSKTRDTRH